jgi:hypothetical protein
VRRQQRPLGLDQAAADAGEQRTEVLAVGHRAASYALTNRMRM